MGSFEIVPDTERRRYKYPRESEWDKIADLLKQGKTLLINNHSRQGIVAGLERRGLKVSLSKRGDSFIVWIRDNG